MVELEITPLHQIVIAYFHMVYRLRFLPNFIDRGRSMVLHDKLSEVIHWHQNHIVIEGSSHRMPRLSAWFGDERYSYSGITHEANLNVNVIRVTVSISSSISMS